MNIDTGRIYDSVEAAKADGVRDDQLVSGTREALEKLKRRIVFTHGSFKIREPERS